MILKIGYNMAQDVKEIIMILAKQVLADAELKNSQPKWRSVKDINTEGLYLRMEDGDLEGNSTFTYLRCIVDVWYMNTLHVRQKLDCKGNKRSLFFGPIPSAPKNNR